VSGLRRTEFEIFRAVSINITVVYAVMPCGLIFKLSFDWKVKALD
jgi:hypothetical protein